MKYIIMSAPLFFACVEPVKEKTINNASVSSLSLLPAGEKFKVDTKETVITWKGSSIGGSHTGYVSISKGELIMENGQLTGGTVELDMNTIEDKDYGSDNGLVKHLKDPDFFDVQKFPSSLFTITKTQPINAEQIKVTANLTIKGITQAVSFPANLQVKDGIVKASGKLVIDRTLWNIRYKSGKFFANLADETISDSIEFTMTVVARK